LVPFLRGKAGRGGGNGPRNRNPKGGKQRCGRPKIRFTLGGVWVWKWKSVKEHLEEGRRPKKGKVMVGVQVLWVISVGGKGLGLNEGVCMEKVKENLGKRSLLEATFGTFGKKEEKKRIVINSTGP